MTERVLIIAAQANDETLGCGGTIARHASAGDRVDVVFLADGETSREGHTVKERHSAALKACGILGANTPKFFDLPDQKLETISFLAITQMIEATVSEFKPTIIYTHHGGDLNLDHRIVHQAVMTAMRPVPANRTHTIYAFEVLSSTEWAGPSIGSPFAPNHFVSIEGTLEKKDGRAIRL